MPNKGETRRVKGDRGFSRNQENSVRGALRIFASGELHNRTTQTQIAEVKTDGFLNLETETKFDALIQAILSGEVETPNKPEASREVIDVKNRLEAAFPGDKVTLFNKLVPGTEIMADLEVTLEDSIVSKVYIVVVKDVLQSKKYFEERSSQEVKSLLKAGVIVLAADRSRAAIVQRYVEVLNTIEKNASQLV